MATKARFALCIGRQLGCTIGSSSRQHWGVLAFACVAPQSDRSRLGHSASLHARSHTRSPPAAPCSSPVPATRAQEDLTMSDPAPQPSTSAPGAAPPAAAAANGSARSSGCPPHVLEVSWASRWSGQDLLCKLSHESADGRLLACRPAVVPAATPLLPCRPSTASRPTRRSSWSAACTAGGQVGGGGGCTACFLPVPGIYEQLPDAACCAVATRCLSSTAAVSSSVVLALAPHHPVQSMPTAKTTRRSTWRTRCCMTGGTCRAQPLPPSAWRALQQRRPLRQQQQQRASSRRSRDRRQQRRRRSSQRRREQGSKLPLRCHNQSVTF